MHKIDPTGTDLCAICRRVIWDPKESVKNPESRHDVICQGHLWKMQQGFYTSQIAQVQGENYAIESDQFVMALSDGNTCPSERDSVACVET